MDDDIAPELDPEPETREPEMGRDADLTALRAVLEDREAELAIAREANRAAVERLRSALAASEPALVPGMLAGDTVEEVEASFAAAKETLARVRERVRQEQALPVGAGAPGRHAPAPLTPLEKIREGLGRG